MNTSMIKRLTLSLFSSAAAVFLSAQSIPKQDAETVAADLSKVAQATASVAPASNGDAETVERDRLRRLPPIQTQASNVPMRSLVKWLAEQAQMAYIAMPQGDVGDTPITLNAYKPAFSILEMLNENYSLGMSFSKGIWHFYGENIHELLARTYQLKYNTTEEFEGMNGTGGGGNGSVTGGSGSSNNASSSLASNGTNGQNNSSGTNGSSGSSVGGGTRIRSDKAKTLVDAITKFLDTSSTAGYATFLRNGSVGEFYTIPAPDLGSSAPANSNPNIKKGNVVFNSDNNQLYILATRQQHEFIEGLLESFDRPQRLIAIETKFLETSTDVSRSLGIDWGGVTSDRNVSISNSGSSGSTATRNLSVPFKFENPGSTPWPANAILSTSEFAVALNAFAGDSTTRTVQYPRVVTVNNRQVSLRSTVTRPVLKGTTQNNTGGGSSLSTQTVEDKDVGTVVDILAKIMEDASGYGSNIMLNIVVSVSNITGSVVLLGNPYPSISNRLFTYQVIVKSGYTLAVGGLQETFDSTSSSKIPGLGDIPFFGLAFKNTNPVRSSRNLMMFVTPTILAGYAGGLSDRPIAVTPLRGTPQRKAFAGSAEESMEDLRAALAGIPNELATIRQIARENSGTKRDITRLDILRNELDLMELRLREEADARRHVSDHKHLASTIDADRKLLASVRGDLRSSMHLPWE